MNTRQPYATDLTDAEWERIQPFVPAPKPGGRPTQYAKRESVTAIRYVVRGGIPWRRLPHDLPPWQVVYH